MCCKAKNLATEKKIWVLKWPGRGQANPSNEATLPRPLLNPRRPRIDLGSEEKKKNNFYIRVFTEY